MGKAKSSPVVGHKAQLFLTITGYDADGNSVETKSYIVKPADMKIGQKKAFEVESADVGTILGGKAPSKYRLVQYENRHADGRWHDCECPSSRFNRSFACKHVVALVSAGLFDPNPEQF